MAAEDASSEYLPLEEQTALGRCGVRDWSQGLVSLPGLQPALLLLLIFNVVLWKRGTCCGWTSARLHCQLLPMSSSIPPCTGRTRWGSWCPAAGSPSHFAVLSLGHPDARAGRSQAQRMGHVCAAESSLVRGEGCGAGSGSSQVWGCLPVSLHIEPHAGSSGWHQPSIRWAWSRAWC